MIGSDPVAYIQRSDYSEYRLEPRAILDQCISTLPENVEINLFTESQLKAERERAIRECAEIAESSMASSWAMGIGNVVKAQILKLLDN
jgi:hypothetical protein